MMLLEVLTVEIHNDALVTGKFFSRLVQKEGLAATTTSENRVVLLSTCVSKGVRHVDVRDTLRSTALNTEILSDDRSEVT